MHILTGDIFLMRSCATTSRSLSFMTLLRNSATSPGCSTSSCSAAPRTASMQLLQEHSAGIPGATAALTPVPITRRRSRGCFLTRLFKNFLEHRKQNVHFSFPGSPEGLRDWPQEFTWAITASAKHQPRSRNRVLHSYTRGWDGQPHRLTASPKPTTPLKPFCHFRQVNVHG